MDKKALTEADIRTKYITPAIVAPGGAWDVMTQVLEEHYFTRGRIMVRGKCVKRDQGKKADYILFYKPNIPLAVIEVKKNTESVRKGMQQALDYADILDIPFAYSSNGDAFLEHDRTGGPGSVEREIPLNQFPSPEELWSRYCHAKGYTPQQQEVLTQDYYDDGSGKTPRYYQTIAINCTIEAIARGENRILLVMATGTGKTYTAFQIIWRLWQSKTKKRILYLADRNILIDQTRVNDFKPFGVAMTKIRNRTVDKSYEIYLALYQAVSGSEEEKNIYRQFSPNFFDLVIVDECHRGSAADDAAWRKILEYFSSATQIGMTATPKETDDVSNASYFKKALYTYSLKEGIEDGFLAPYKVVRVDIDKDLTGWRPEQGKRDKYGQLIEDRIYNQKDFDRNLVLEQRTQLVAKKVSEFLKTTNRYNKTIVFCENIDHAERMRQALVNENADLTADNHRYVMCITGDNEMGKIELDNFIDPESDYPVIATTSKLMSTGVDAQTCKLIVLDQRIQSMTLFKQIIGRGTRINEDHDKFYFTIMDFKKATELFADPNFDGNPVQVYIPPEEGPVVLPDPEGDEEKGGVDGGADSDDTIIDIQPPNDNFPPGDSTTPGEKRVKYIVGDVAVYVVAERVQYYDTGGKLITDSLRDYTRRNVRKEYASLNEFLGHWDEVERKQAVINELEKEGVLLEALAEEVGRDYDPFDLICHVAFDQPPLTRRERAENVRKNNYFTRYGAEARAVLHALLDKYADEGITNIEDMGILKIQPLSNFGTPIEILNRFGGKEAYQKALRDLEAELYATQN